MTNVLEFPKPKKKTEKKAAPVRVRQPSRPLAEVVAEADTLWRESSADQNPLTRGLAARLNDCSAAHFLKDVVRLLEHADVDRDADGTRYKTAHFTLAELDLMAELARRDCAIMEDIVRRVLDGRNR